MSCNVNICKLEELVRKALGVPDDVALLVAAQGERMVAILAKKNVGTLILDVTPNDEFDSCEELAHHIASTNKAQRQLFLPPNLRRARDSIAVRHRSVATPKRKGRLKCVNTSNPTVIAVYCKSKEAC